MDKFRVLRDIDIQIGGAQNNWPEEGVASGQPALEEGVNQSRRGNNLNRSPFI